MSIDESKRTTGRGWPCSHCTATGTEPGTKEPCTKGCNDGFVKLIGYHDLLPVEVGNRVRIRKGTLIRTLTKGERLAGRTYVILVHHTLSGIVDTERHIVENPKVRWPGPGGYWSEADINDVELVTPNYESPLLSGRSYGGRRSAWRFDADTTFALEVALKRTDS